MQAAALRRQRYMESSLAVPVGALHELHAHVGVGTVVPVDTPLALRVAAVCPRVRDGHATYLPSHWHGCTGRARRQ